MQGLPGRLLLSTCQVSRIWLETFPLAPLPPPPPPSPSPFCLSLHATLSVSLSWGLAMCVCVLSLSVSVLLLLSPDVALCLRPPFSLSLSLPLFKGPSQISILWHLSVYLSGHFCSISKVPASSGLGFLGAVTVACFVFCSQPSSPGGSQSPFALGLFTTPPVQIFALFL